MTEHFARPREKRPCLRCGINDTRSAARLCAHCRPAPEVSLRDNDLVFIAGIGLIGTSTALVLAHRIADLLTPSFMPPPGATSEDHK